MRRARFVLPLLAWAVVLGLLPHVAEPAPLPPAATHAADPAGLETRLVVAHLVRLGATPEEARSHVARLTEGERQALARRLDEVEAGGSAAAALAIAIIVGLIAIIVLELLGRRIVSRPLR